MDKFRVDGAEIEYKVQGWGEPILFIHGNTWADALLPLSSEPSIASKYQTINFHRRGYAGSSHSLAARTYRDESADSLALLDHLGVKRAHVCGHSYGAAVALQFAADNPDRLLSLTVLEAPLLHAVPSGAPTMEALGPLFEVYGGGDKAGAVDGFMNAMVGPGYQDVVQATLPAGALDQGVADADTLFQVEMQVMGSWQFGAEDARRIPQPVLAVAGAETGPPFKESHDLIRQWIPDAEELVIPETTHGFPIQNPSAVADGMVSFLASHERKASSHV